MFISKKEKLKINSRIKALEDLLQLEECNYGNISNPFKKYYLSKTIDKINKKIWLIKRYLGVEEINKTENKLVKKTKKEK